MRFTKRRFLNEWKLFVQLREDKILKIAEANLFYKKTLKVCYIILIPKNLFFYAFFKVMNLRMNSMFTLSNLKKMLLL